MLTLTVGCSEASEEPAAPPSPADAAGAAPPAAPAPAERTSPSPAPGPTVGGDGSAIELTPLTGADIEAADLQGELGCSFADGGETPLLIAMGDVASKEPAYGLVKIGDYVERLAAPGGFDAIVGGATFSGRGTTIRITLTGPASGDGESPPHPATLTFDRMDGARRTFAGRWSCGP